MRWGIGRNPWLKVGGTIVVAMALAWVTLALFVLIFGDKLLYPVPRRSYRDDSLVIKLPVEGVGRVSAVLLPYPGTRRTLLYSHGNGEDLGTAMPRMQVLRDLGFNVFAYDYPGYGTSEGEPSEASIRASSEAAFEYLRSRLHLEDNDIVLYGRSLGAGPAVWLATQHNVAGLITESAFTSAYRVPIPTRLLWWDTWDNLALLPRVQCPMLIIQGSHDRIVHPWHAMALLDASPPHSQFFLADAGHNDVVEAAGENYWHALKRYFAMLQQDIPNSQPTPPDVQQTRTRDPR